MPRYKTKRKKPWGSVNACEGSRYHSLTRRFPHTRLRKALSRIGEASPHVETWNAHNEEPPFGKKIGGWDWSEQWRSKSQSACTAYAEGKYYARVMIKSLCSASQGPNAVDSTTVIGWTEVHSSRISPSRKLFSVNFTTIAIRGWIRICFLHRDMNFKVTCYKWRWYLRVYIQSDILSYAGTVRDVTLNSISSDRRVRERSRSCWQCRGLSCCRAWIGAGGTLQVACSRFFPEDVWHQWKPRAEPRALDTAPRAPTAPAASPASKPPPTSPPQPSAKPPAVRTTNVSASSSPLAASGNYWWIYSTASLRLRIENSR